MTTTTTDIDQVPDDILALAEPAPPLSLRDEIEQAEALAEKKKFEAVQDVIGDRLAKAFDKFCDEIDLYEIAGKAVLYGKSPYSNSAYKGDAERMMDAAKKAVRELLTDCLNEAG